MPRITANPNLAEAPDFTIEVYAIARNAIAAAQNITPEQAAETLKAAWTADREAAAQEEED